MISMQGAISKTENGEEAMNSIVKKILIIAICLAFLAFAAFAVVDMAAFSKVLKKTMDDKICYETNQFANRLSMIFYICLMLTSRL